MKLIFTSFGYESPIVFEKLRKCTDTENKTVAVLPYAGFNIEETYLYERRNLIKFGFSEDNIILGNNANITQIDKVDYIYVSGGDTFKLLDYVKSNNMTEQIHRNVGKGAVYIGSSAGAILATTDLEYVNAIEDNNFSFTDYAGLGLCNDIIIPHSDQMPYAIIEKSKQLCDITRKVLLIKNCDIVIINNENGVVNYTYID